MARFDNRRVGVLALQGDYPRHQYQLQLLGIAVVQVRLPEHLDEIDSIILPGGESTTMDILLDRFDLRQPLKGFCRTHPVYATCAGMILLSKKIEDNQSGVKPLGLLDVDVMRNGYGRQIFSFEQELPAGLGETPRNLTATFIRAPRITRLGEGIEVLARFRDDPVLVRQGNILAASFHTELDDDTTLLEFFLQQVPKPAAAGN